MYGEMGTRLTRMKQKLYGKIAKKIKGLAIFAFVVEAIAAIISGLLLIISDEDMIIIGLPIIIFGPFVAWISTWLLFGLGEVVDKLTDIERNTRDVNMRYSEAVEAMNTANSEKGYIEASKLFAGLGDYKDSAELKNKCLENAEIPKKDGLLSKAKNLMESATLYSFTRAVSLLKKIPGWKNSDKMLSDCLKEIEVLKPQAERIRKTILKVSLIVVSVIVCAVIVFYAVIVPNNKYNKAVALLNNGYYMEAYEAFSELGDYKDSLLKMEIAQIMNGLESGSVVKYGAYEQDNDLTNGKEKIEWVVLDKNEESILVTSKYALDCQPYNTELVSVSWENCTLRSWLNNEFVNEAFSDEEKVAISNEFTDQIFLLSEAEAREYFRSSDKRKCAPTTYAQAQGARIQTGRHCYWWLLNAEIDKFAYRVDSYGGINIKAEGPEVNKDYIAVRPAMWIDLGA